ncbi:MAG: hypothetical protein PHX78_02120 [bacterium]|nr:hypothetical protein [bacterium]
MKYFQIETAAVLENEQIKKALIEYGCVLVNANDFVGLLWEFVEGYEDKALNFIYFLSQVQKSLTLALLSTLRKHDVQMNLMLRHALESAVLACYGLFEANTNEFGTVNTDGILNPNDKVKDKAYKWLDEKYRSYSEKIKDMKDIINKNSAHPNIAQTLNNCNFAENLRTITFLDEVDILFTKHRLWWIANISYGLLDLFEKVIKDYPIVKLDDGFIRKLEKLYVENEKIKQELIKK